MHAFTAIPLDIMLENLTIGRLGFQKENTSRFLRNSPLKLTRKDPNLYGYLPQNLLIVLQVNKLLLSRNITQG